MIGLDVPAGLVRRDDRRAHGPVAAERRVDELLVVDRVAQRVAEGGVGQRRGRSAVALLDAAGVEGELRVAIGDAGHGLDVRIALQGVELVRQDVPDVVELTGLQRLDHRVGCRELGEDDLVLGALLGAPIVRVAGEPDELARLPLHGLVGAGPDDRRLVLEEPGLLRIADLGQRVLRPDVLRQDRDVGLEDDRVREVRGQDERLGIRRLDLVQAGIRQVRLEVPLAEVAALGGDAVEDRLVRPASVLGGGGLAVRPLHPGPDLERPLLAVRGLGPRLGEARDQIDVRPEVDQQVVVEGEDLEVGHGDRLERVERPAASGPCRPAGRGCCPRRCDVPAAGSIVARTSAREPATRAARPRKGVRMTNLLLVGPRSSARVRVPRPPPGRSARKDRTRSEGLQA